MQSQFEFVGAHVTIFLSTKNFLYLNIKEMTFNPCIIISFGSLPILKTSWVGNRDSFPLSEYPKIVSLLR